MGPGFESLKVHQKGIIRTFYSSQVIGSDLLFYFWNYNKGAGLADISQALLLYIDIDTLNDLVNYTIKCNRVNKKKEFIQICGKIELQNQNLLQRRSV